MKILKESVIIPLGRMFFIPKEGDLKAEDLIIETAGKYRVIDKPDCIAVQNDDCCNSIKVTIKIKD
ncbi:hypothetical protein Dtox_1912 [Desulfofarcimen acetoxidans DSM 771]|jgi:hypothetical protein|uniref:Uncharacterized protein n=1 Tax=Desulfofarcimen acetoxidans (strain ATCC 49208 / DSM 771 / KCTC 5769 / VKM B-1644 / 5575) TaxID=485916 RepID=C8VXU7_DESAS|nr:hypothetical protein [Desulfofarcimen acetoxidans]ACV62753.1 hypothetical protein Dtox_1912 [Desulfofarcimen acetoxidans DSM 771]